MEHRLPAPLSTWRVLQDGRVHPLGQRPTGQGRWTASKGRRRLSDDQVRTIRRRLAGGERASTVARDFPVSAATAASIGRGDSWKGVG